LVLNNLFGKKPRTISELAIASIIEISRYLELDTEFKIASVENYDKGKDKIENLIKICKTEGALIYINAIGGKNLYSKSDFKPNGINLLFLQTGISHSILDYCFTMDIETIRHELNNYRLIEAD